MACPYRSRPEGLAQERWGPCRRGATSRVCRSPLADRLCGVLGHLITENHGSGSDPGDPLKVGRAAQCPGPTQRSKCGLVLMGPLDRTTLATLPPGLTTFQSRPPSLVLAKCPSAPTQPVVALEKASLVTKLVSRLLGRGPPSTVQVSPPVLAIARRVGYGSLPSWTPSTADLCHLHITEDRVTPTPIDGLRKSIEARSAGGTRDPATRDAGSLLQASGSTIVGLEVDA